MIFVTVGTQLPFDRLIRAVDAWAQAHPDAEVFAQIGPGEYKPQYARWGDFVSPEEFDRYYAESQAIVAHAGMGTILTALQMAKPLLVLPRRADLGEHRNDHQVATARRFDAMGKVAVAFDESELSGKLDALLDSQASERIGAEASPGLIAALRGFIHEGKAG